MDSEACADDGHKGIDAVFTERKRADGAMALFLFEVLHLVNDAPSRVTLARRPRVPPT